MNLNLQQNRINSTGHASYLDMLPCKADINLAYLKVHFSRRFTVQETRVSSEMVNMFPFLWWAKLPLI